MSPWLSLPHPPQLGTYNPLPYSLDGAKEVRLKVDRIKYWLSVGAQASDRVAYLLWRAGLAPAPPLRFAPQQAKSKQAPPAAGFHTLSAAAAAAGAVGGRRGAAAFLRPAPGLAAFSGAFSRLPPGGLMATMLR